MQKKIIFFLAVLLLAHFLLVIYCIKQNAPTCDEIAHHIASGYSYLKMRDFRINPANPPLIREISALPLLFLSLKAPFDLKSWEEGNSPVFGRQFFYESGNDPDKIIFWARFPIAILSVILGFLVFLWSRALYGDKAGLLSVGLYSFSPNIMASAGLATVDLGASLFILAALFSFWAYIRKPNIVKLIISGVLFGLAQAAKYTSIYLMPVFILLGVINYFSDKNKRKSHNLSNIVIKIFLIFFIGFIIAWATYFFEFKPLLENAPDIPEKIDYIKNVADKYSLSKIGLTQEKMTSFALNVPIPLSEYIVGLLGVINQNAVGGIDVFLFGQHSQQGFWNYFFVTFLVKSTIPFLLLFGLAIMLFLKSKDRNMKASELFIIIPAIFLFLTVLTSKVQMGVRHILPIYPLIFTFIGKAATINLKKYIKGVLICIFIFWQLYCLLRVFPYPIAYFNELVGGPKNGYKILRGSNLDWGQGLKALKSYVDKNKIDKVKLLYFGTASPDYYKIPYENIKEQELKMPGKGIYAISAQYLDAAQWTKDKEPVEKIAYSIFIYEVK